MLSIWNMNVGSWAYSMDRLLFFLMCFKSWWHHICYSKMHWEALHHLAVSLHHFMLSIHGVFFVFFPPTFDVAQSCHLFAQCKTWTKYCTLLLIKGTQCSLSQITLWHCFGHAHVMSNLVCWPTLSCIILENIVSNSKCFYMVGHQAWFLCDRLTWDGNSHVL